MLLTLFEILPKEASNKRLEICDTCEHKKTKIIKYCGVCGCSIDAKVKFRKQTCPQKKW